MTWETFTAMVGMLSGLCAILFGVRNIRRDSAKQIREDALSLARIENKLDSAVHGIEEMRRELSGHSSQISDFDSRMARCEEGLKNACERINRIEKGEINRCKELIGNAS